jgi:hypothetical protein
VRERIIINPITTIAATGTATTIITMAVTAATSATMVKTTTTIITEVEGMEEIFLPLPAEEVVDMANTTVTVAEEAMVEVVVVVVLDVVEVEAIPGSMETSQNIINIKINNTPWTTTITVAVRREGEMTTINKMTVEEVTDNNTSIGIETIIMGEATSETTEGEEEDRTAEAAADTKEAEVVEDRGVGNSSNEEEEEEITVEAAAVEVATSYYHQIQELVC